MIRKLENFFLIELFYRLRSTCSVSSEKIGRNFLNTELRLTNRRCCQPILHYIKLVLLN